MALKNDNKVFLETKEMFQSYSSVVSNFDHFLRPPIKFLALLVNAINKKTQFGAGYFSEEQLAGNLTTKEQKMDFLKMLHLYTEYVNKAHVKVDEAMIAAGKDVENTLMLLQAMLKGSENPKMDFTTAGKKAMMKFEKEKNDGAAAKPKPKEEQPPQPKPQAEQPPQPKPQAEPNPQPKQREEPNPQPKQPVEQPPQKPKDDERAKQREEEKLKQKAREEEKARQRLKEEEKKKSVIINIEDDDSPHGARPMTAGKAPPKVKEETTVILESKVATIIKEADEVEDAKDDVFVEELTGGVPLIPKGEGLKLGQLIHAEIAKDNPNTPQTSESYDADRFKQSIEYGRTLLQHLARAAQPLDQLIQFSQEDLGNMENEYIRWADECKRQEKNYDLECKKTQDSLHELNSKVDDLNNDIARQESKLRSLKAAALYKESELMKDFTALCQN